MLKFLLLILAFGLNAEAMCRRWGSPPPFSNGCGPEQTIRNEGVCLCCYYDTVGIPTIGIGVNLQRSDAASLMRRYGLDLNNVLSDCQRGSTEHCLSNHEAYDLFKDEIYPEFSRYAENFVYGMPEEVQAAVTDVAFAGIGKLRDTSKFPNFRQHLEQRDFHAAADDLQRTGWCRSVGMSRCQSNVECIRRAAGHGLGAASAFCGPSGSGFWF